MKSIEAIIPHPSVRPAIAQLHTLGVREITVEPVQVYRSDVHQTMIHRGCTYEQHCTSESRLRFDIDEQNARQAENLLADAVTGQR